MIAMRSFPWLLMTCFEAFLQRKFQKEQAITGLLDGSGEFTLVYEDDEGDKMLVGDVPWEEDATCTSGVSANEVPASTTTSASTSSTQRGGRERERAGPRGSPRGRGGSNGIRRGEMRVDVTTRGRTYLGTPNDFITTGGGHGITIDREQDCRWNECFWKRKTKEKTPRRGYKNVALRYKNVDQVRVRAADMAQTSNSQPFES